MCSMRIHGDSLLGWMLGIITVCVVGEIWIVPWMDWLEVLWTVVIGRVGGYSFFFVF